VRGASRAAGGRPGAANAARASKQSNVVPMPTLPSGAVEPSAAVRQSAPCPLALLAAVAPPARSRTSVRSTVLPRLCPERSAM
jgi:hypothetical protein